MSIKRGKSTFFLRFFLLLLTAANIYPILFTIFTSLKTREEFLDNMWSLPHHLNFGNYVEAFHIGRMNVYLFNSVIIAVVSLCLGTVIGIFAAYALARLKVFFAASIVGFLFILMILPGESMIIPLYMMMSKLHLFKVMYASIIIAYLGWLLPGSIVILRNFFLSIPNELLESARMDGCGELGTMFRIVFPLSGAAVATVTVFNFGFVWGELLWARIATLTTDAGVPLSVGLLNFQGQYETNWVLLTSGLCMVLLPLILLVIFLQKYFVQGLTSGAVKG